MNIIFVNNNFFVGLHIKNKSIAFVCIEFSMLLLLGAIGGIVYLLRNLEKEETPTIVKN